MAYDIKLYAHGVPGGQSTWGVTGSDSTYIEAFYGRTAGVSPVMFVEVRQFDSSANCYYTYFVGNTSEKNGRTGGYFALTLRMNYYYADTQNMYNLLNAAYNKFVVGQIISATGGGARFLVSDLEQASGVLSSLEQELRKYLMQFSSDSDFISLSGFMVNAQGGAAKINLLECESGLVADLVKSNGSISVSPFHPSSREQQSAQQMNATMEAVKRDARQQIDAAKQNASREVSAAQQQARADIENTRRDKENAIQSIRNEYKDADAKIKNLSKDLEDARNEINRLKNEKNILADKLKKAEACVKELKEAQKEFAESKDLMQRIKDNVSGLKDVVETLGGKKGNSLMGRIRRMLPFVNLFVMLILILVVALSLPGNSKERTLSTIGAGLDNDAIERLESQIKELVSDALKDAKPTRGGNAGVKDVDIKRFLACMLPGARIDISGMSNSNPMKFNGGGTYTVSIKNVNTDLGGTWKSSDFDISEKGVLTPRHAGECEISYEVLGVTFLTRTINVVE